MYNNTYYIAHCSDVIRRIIRGIVSFTIRIAHLPLYYLNGNYLYYVIR